MTLEVRLWLLAAAALCAFFALGYAVTHASSPPWIDAGAGVVRGGATSLALVFTTSGRSLALLGIALVGIAVAALTRTHVVAVVAVGAAQVLSQGAVELCKDVFRRTRPDDWLVHHEMGYSYPSGHATTAMVFFGSWVVLAMISSWPMGVRIFVASLLVLWMLGIDWSRLALAAHYPTDVIGGTLFGLAWASALWALFVHYRLVIPAGWPSSGMR